MLLMFPRVSYRTREKSHAGDRSRRQDVSKTFPAEIDRLCRFGQIHRYSRNQPLFVTGEIAPGIFVLKTGRVKVTRRNPLGRLAPIVEQDTGNFVGEVGQLSGRPALWTFTHSKTWKRFSPRPRSCGPL